MVERPEREETSAAAEGPAAARDHLANERTLLAWVRTALTVIGLGFIVARFASDVERGSTWAVLIGAGVVLAGGLTVVAGLVRFLTVERQIDRATYRPSPTVHVLLTGLVIVMALLILLYVLLVPPLTPTR